MLAGNANSQKENQRGPAPTSLNVEIPVARTRPNQNDATK
jgi:hypothetical protein